MLGRFDGITVMGRQTHHVPPLVCSTAAQCRYSSKSKSECLRLSDCRTWILQLSAQDDHEASYAPVRKDLSFQAIRNLNDLELVGLEMLRYLNLRMLEAAGELALLEETA